MTGRHPITAEGHKRLKEELDRLIRVERPKAARAVGVAREHGDLSENAEYEAAKDAQGMLEAKIRNMEGQLGAAEIIDPREIKSERIVFGATVRVMDLETDKESEYQIVGELEADLDKGMISVNSPIARALIGKETGDIIDLRAPGGIRSLEILGVSYG
ncbi:MAG: transcription elongation factor GreA [Deltaproteobacteria bacterium]|nr:transcription elongation factor GreA [Deltaproteobacteria bacterium]